MAADLRDEECLECYRPLRTDGIVWACKPCGRGGSYQMHGSIRVRIVEYWRPAQQRPESTFERIRRAA